MQIQKKQVMTSWSITGRAHLNSILTG